MSKTQKQNSDRFTVPVLWGVQPLLGAHTSVWTLQEEPSMTRPLPGFPCFSFATHLNFFFFVFFRATSVAYGVPRLGVESGLQLPPYTIATAMLYLNAVCDLHHSSQQCHDGNPCNSFFIPQTCVACLPCARRCWPLLVILCGGRRE